MIDGCGSFQSLVRVLLVEWILRLGSGNRVCGIGFLEGWAIELGGGGLLEAGTAKDLKI